MSKGITLGKSCLPLVIAALLSALMGLAPGQSRQEKTPVAPTPQASEAKPAPLPAEGIYLEGFRLDISRAGVTRQKLTAAQGRFDPKKETLDLNALHVLFYDDLTTRGEALSGHGRIWLKDDPARKIEKDDILLDQTVRFITRDGWVLQSPQMRFTQKDSTLRTNQGYVKQLSLEKGYLVARGKSFEITLSLDQNTFTRWREMGDPKTGQQVTFEKSDKPVIKP